MNDYYIKTSSEQELWTTLTQLGLAQWAEDAQRFIPIGINLDIIGTIYKSTDNMNMMMTAEGVQFVEQIPIDGFHANIRGILTEEQQSALPLISAPVTPHRVWL